MSTKVNLSQPIRAQRSRMAPADTKAAKSKPAGSKPASSKPARKNSTANAAGEVRIIGGLWKRSKLPVANRPGLRPTPDRVRETLFNWLGQDMSGLRCVDAFAGTGALGFEAASRGALDVLLVEGDTSLITQLAKSKDKLKADKVRVQRGDGIAILQGQASGSVDVIFIDPPFEAPIFEKVLAAAAKAITAQGAIYLEAPKTWTDADLAAYGLQVHKAGKAGAVHYHLLHRTNCSTL